MLNGRSVVALIPARGGSKSVKRKNLRLLGGEPLLKWPIRVALETECIDKIIVSTDDDEIAALAEESGVQVALRPSHLAQDESLVADVIRHIWAESAECSKSDVIYVLLEPTSPFRNSSVITKCVSRLLSENLDSIATFHQSPVSPHRMWRLEGSNVTPFINGVDPWQPRQKLEVAYQLNGAVYAFYPGRLPARSSSILFGRIGAEVLDSESVIDIDTYHDFKVANAILMQKNVE